MIPTPSRLHADVYFRALTIRRVLLFHDVLAKHVQDPRLRQARAKFDPSAPKAKELRDFYRRRTGLVCGSPQRLAGPVSTADDAGEA